MERSCTQLVGLRYDHKVPMPGVNEEKAEKAAGEVGREVKVELGAVVPSSAAGVCLAVGEWEIILRVESD